MPNNVIDLIFVVNGEDVELLRLNVREPLRAARNKALAQSGNTGRPLDEWEIRTEAGVLLSPDTKIETLDIKPRTKLFLSLAVGAGGDRSCLVFRGARGPWSFPATGVSPTP